MLIETSILEGTKKILGFTPDYDAFDQDLIIHINSALFTLYDIGVGPREGFQITGADETWGDFTAAKNTLGAISSCVYLKVRLVFDPPQTNHHLEAMKEQIRELEARLMRDAELIRHG